MILLAAVIVLRLIEEIDTTALIVHGLLAMGWMVASWQCLCRPYLPFLSAKDADGCRGAFFCPFTITRVPHGHPDHDPVFAAEIVVFGLHTQQTQ